MHTSRVSHPFRPLQPHVRQAIDAIRADTSKYERYAADPQILAVLQASPDTLALPWLCPVAAPCCARACFVRACCSASDAMQLHA